MHKGYGVQVIMRNVLEEGVADIAGTFDVITTFDSMEHWHHSPKKLFRQVMDKLKPGGWFVLGVPNCMNMRKRITTVAGVGKWSGMEEWYEQDRFRGHVREPDVDDLKYIAQDMQLQDCTIYGRNWLGYYSQKPIIRFLTMLMDYPLRLRPQLCSDIYLVARKRRVADIATPASGKS